MTIKHNIINIMIYTHKLREKSHFHEIIVTKDFLIIQIIQKRGNI